MRDENHPAQMQMQLNAMLKRYHPETRLSCTFLPPPPKLREIRYFIPLPCSSTLRLTDRLEAFGVDAKGEGVEAVDAHHLYNELDVTSYKLCLSVLTSKSSHPVNQKPTMTTR